MRHILPVALLMFVAILESSSVAPAQTTAATPDQVEEDWELVVAAADFEAVGPQITTSMGPAADLASNPFVAFNLNYREYPDYTPGGMQVQVWSGKQLVTTATQMFAQLNTANETVTWTQRMSLSGGSITYSVNNGMSTTWGTFGPFSVNFATTLASLAGYSPDVSLANSGVSWQSDHVTSMKLVQVRYYAGGKLVSTDPTARSVTLKK
jgi:hypothetical protein